MFGKKKEHSVETNGIVYRRAKTWRVALAGCSSGIGMCFYVLLGLASYVANAGYGIATAVVGIILTATRILDGVTDPIISIIIDKMNTRFGKIRILMVAGWRSGDAYERPEAAPDGRRLEYGLQLSGADDS